MTPANIASAADYLARAGVEPEVVNFLREIVRADSLGQSSDWTLERTVIQQRIRPAWTVRNSWGDAWAYGAPHYNGWSATLPTAPEIREVMDRVAAAAPTTTITGMTYEEFRSEAARLVASVMMQDDPCDTSPSQIKVTVDNTPWE